MRADEAWAILKVVCGEEFYRVPLAGPREIATLRTAVASLECLSSGSLMKYVDCHGNESRLDEGSFTDFLATCKASASGRLPTLTVSLSPQSATGQTDGPKEACESSRSSPGRCNSHRDDEHINSNPDCALVDEELEAVAWAEEAQAACRDLMAKHLKDWLASDPDPLSFEAWLCALHPDSCSPERLDPRMFLENSQHRLLWNRALASLSGLTQVDRDAMYVHPMDSPTAGDLLPSAPPLSEWTLLDPVADLQPSAPPPDIISRMAPHLEAEPASADAAPAPTETAQAPAPPEEGAEEPQQQHERSPSNEGWWARFQAGRAARREHCKAAMAARKEAMLTAERLRKDAMAARHEAWRHHHECMRQHRRIHCHQHARQAARGGRRGCGAGDVEHSPDMAASAIWLQHAAAQQAHRAAMQQAADAHHSAMRQAAEAHHAAMRHAVEVQRSCHEARRGAHCRAHCHASR